MDLTVFINEFKEKDYKNFDIFYNETHKQIYFTSYGILKSEELAEDIMQETYMIFLKTIDRVNEEKSIYQYLITIARNKSLNYIKREKNIIHNDEVFDKIGERTKSSDKINQILDLIEDRIEREIIVYHVLFDYKFKDIAKMIDMPLGTVLWKYNKTIKELKKEVIKLYEN